MKDSQLKELLQKHMTRKEFLKCLFSMGLGAIGLYAFFNQQPANSVPERQEEYLAFGASKFGV